MDLKYSENLKNRTVRAHFTTVAAHFTNSPFIRHDPCGHARNDTMGSDLALRMLRIAERLQYISRGVT